MNFKSLNNKKQLSILIICSFFIFGCHDYSQVEQAKILSDQLINNISKGEIVYNSFPEKTFNKEITIPLMEELRIKCDFENRKGNFVNEFTQSYFQFPSIDRRVAFIYEFHLKCDSVRFILSYKLGKVIELYEFKLESIKKDNPMITKPERRLKPK